MVAYGFAWRALCWVLGVIGVAAAVVILPLEALVALGLLVVVGGLTAAVGYEQGDGPPRYSRRQTVVLTMAGCSGVTAVVGLGAVLGMYAIWLLLILAAASPPAIRWYGGKLATKQPAGPADDGQVHTTVELCRQWRDSYDALRQASTPAAQLRIVMARQRCLDELERRDPDGLHAWLASTASAAGDPSRYLTRSDAEPPADS